MNRRSVVAVVVAAVVVVVVVVVVVAAVVVVAVVPIFRLGTANETIFFFDFCPNVRIFPAASIDASTLKRRPPPPSTISGVANK